MSVNFMSIVEELVYYKDKPEQRHNLLSIQNAAELIFSRDLRLHYYLSKKALDEDLLFFVKQFFAMCTPQYLTITYQNHWQNILHKPITVFKCPDGNMVLTYIRTKVSRIIAMEPIHLDPRLNPMAVYRGAVKLNKVLHNDSRIIF